jgi:hypothetical protein
VNQQPSKNPDELGALWTKEGKAGKYMTGYIEVNGQRIDIVVFTNNKRKSDKSPNARILRSKPREQQSQPLEDLTPPDMPF